MIAISKHGRPLLPDLRALFSRAIRPATRPLPPQAAAQADTLVPPDLLLGRMLICLGLAPAMVAQIRPWAAALGGTVLSVATPDQALAAARSGPAILLCRTATGPQDATLRALRDAAADVPLICLSQATDLASFEAPDPASVDAALRAPLTRTALCLGLQAALANRAFHNH